MHGYPWTPRMPLQSQCVLSHNMELHCIFLTDTRYIPFSSINAQFEKLARRKRRLIVYNKADLADPSAEEAGDTRYEDKKHIKHLALYSPRCTVGIDNLSGIDALIESKSSIYRCQQ
jgi:tRNA U34 5-carboxymethylaminomethyl modifying GTPase MnmE/TrmE